MNIKAENYPAVTLDTWNSLPANILHLSEFRFHGSKMNLTLVLSSRVAEELFFPPSSLKVSILIHSTYWRKMYVLCFGMGVESLLLKVISNLLNSVRVYILSRWLWLYSVLESELSFKDTSRLLSLKYTPPWSRSWNLSR